MVVHGPPYQSSHAISTATLAPPTIVPPCPALQRLLSPGSATLPLEDASAGGSAFTAHPHTDSNTGRLAFYTYTMLPAGALRATHTASAAERLTG